MSFAANLDALLSRLNITQEELAKAAGVSPGAVSGWKNGANPRKSVIARLCSEYDLTEDDLLSDASGLAAKAARAASAPAFANVPLVAGVNPKVEKITTKQFVTAPADLLKNRPNAYAVVVKDDGMSQVLPVGSHAIIDPDEPVPENGSIVAFKMEDFQAVDFLWTSGHRILFRKWYVGVSHIMLSPRSYREKIEDTVMRLEDAASSIELLGTVVWFQSTGKLG